MWRRMGTVETEKLRTIQQPSQVAALLESFVWSVDILPDGARKLLDRSELPGPRCCRARPSARTVSYRSPHVGSPCGMENGDVARREVRHRRTEQPGRSI